MTTNTITEFRVEKATLIDRIVGYFKMRRFMRNRKPAHKA